MEKLKKEEKETLRDRGSQGVECHVWYRERKKSCVIELSVTCGIEREKKSYVIELSVMCGIEREKKNLV